MSESHLQPDIKCSIVWGTCLIISTACFQKKVKSTCPFDVGKKHGWRDSGVKSSDQGRDTGVPMPEAT